MTYTRDWDNNDPINHIKNSTWPAEIREVMDDVAERMASILYGFLAGETDEGAKNIPYIVQGADPGATANKIKSYAKDVSGKAEKFYQDEDGNVLQLTAGGKFNLVDLVSAQAVAGIKTFGSIPVLPASNPTADNQVSRKAYVDSAVAAAVAAGDVDKVDGYDAASFLVSAIKDYGTSLTTSTSKNQSALKIAYGTTTINNTSATVTNLPFGSASTYVVFLSVIEDTQDDRSASPKYYRVSGSSFRIRQTMAISIQVSWFAIGT